LKNLFRDYTNDFFDILYQRKEVWNDFWNKFEKKKKEIFSEYLKQNNYTKEQTLEKLEKTERRFIDKAYWYKEEIIHEIKNKVVHMLTENVEKYNLGRDDFVIHIEALFGEKPYFYVETYKATIIVIDYMHYYINKDSQPSLEKVIDEAILNFIEKTQTDKRKGFFFGLMEDAKKIIYDNKNNKDKALTKICEMLDKKVSYYNWTGFYFVSKEDKNILEVGPYIGEKTDHIKIEFGEGICGQAASTEQTFIIGDVSKESNYLSCSDKTKSEIVVPIFNKEGKIAGEIDIDSHVIDPFDEKDKMFLEELAQLITEYFF
jgi:GAF domain-containing protein